jgi:hypothetical protein
MNNIRIKISDIVGLKIKPNHAEFFETVGSKIYNKVNNKTVINSISNLTKNRVYYDIKFRKKYER